MASENDEKSAGSGKSGKSGDSGVPGALHVIQRGIAVTVLVVVVAGLYAYWQMSDHAPTVQTPPPQPPPVVETVVVEAESVPLVPQYLGQVEASQVVEVHARVAGFLEERAFEEGAVVEPGRLLYRIDPRSFEADLAIAQAKLAGAQAQLELAQTRLERFERLAGEGVATTEELEEGRTAQQVAQAQVQLAKAQIAQAELDLSYTTIRSPIRGVIGESRVDEGTYVRTGADSLLAVVRQMDPIYVRLSVSEEESLRFQAMVESGQIQTPDLDAFEVHVTLSTGQAYPHPGKISFVDVEVDPTTGTRMVRASVPNPDRLLVPGQFVQAVISGAVRTGAILVPQQAVSQAPTGSLVYVVAPDGTVEQRPVTLGRWYRDRWIVEEGLEAGDRVVTDHLSRMRPGLEVELAR